ncbi:phospholipid/cholesterol/gamma-HCH transport system substrate-binding protein [Kribbella orskensis]|uniref:Phospholipid/cholesterol/gamma-HCH transport system substrate-binding protein n=1 Tax=Kribbella orskensis TaxID=2512216 RepID=A0ABY2BHP7_9ACTN|nr:MULTISPECIES: MlaD family protein [Kribbella]TCN38641.1 phospholipid/cholesterol/gamma-HCH transport system substrate-binding protein [Kribbella sp. VKM Ac-2500]TCO20822.1 phospholipid/cholesterol/gamma-HCH transport system substrate-binding protein [Kribbella orskensis]
MISKTVRVQLMVFLLITVVGVAYVGGKYAQVDQLLFDDDYTVSASFAESGGIFSGAEVTYRGQPVGRVGKLELLSDGVEVDLDIDKEVKIPNDLVAVVANRSAIGEQYVDLQPRRDDGPYLQDRSKIARQDTAIPIDTTELLLNLDQLVNSVDKNSLKTTVQELGDALRGKGSDLQKIIDSSGLLINDADANILQTIKLINDGSTVLATQVASGDAIKTWAKNLALLSETLVSSDANLRSVIDNGSAASQQVTALIQENRADIAVLLGNLLTVNEMTAVRLDAVEQLLVVYPAVAMGGYVVPAKDPGTGHYDAHFGLVLGFSPPACRAGYNGTDKRVPQDTTNKPANTKAGCTASPGSGVNVRGSQNKPTPSSRSDANRIGYGVGYDPATGAAGGTDGMPELVLGSTGGQEELLGKDSWKALILGPVSGQ